MSTRQRMNAHVVAFLLLIVVFTVAQSQSGETAGSSSQAMSARYEDLTWQTMVAELGNAFQVRNSVRPKHLFGHNLDYERAFERNGALLRVHAGVTHKRLLADLNAAIEEFLIIVRERLKEL